MKKTLSVLILLVASVCAMAQMADPVHFTSKLVMLGGDEAQIEFLPKSTTDGMCILLDWATTDQSLPHSTHRRWTV